MKIKNDHVNDTNLLQNNEHENALRKKTGLVSGLAADWAASREAGKALKDLETERIRAIADLGMQAINQTKTALSAALLAEALPRIGALTTQANAASAAVDQSLTNGAQAEYYTHMSNRTSNHSLNNSLLQAKKISSEEAQVLNDFADAAAVDDIQRSRARMQMAKETVAALHAEALSGIESVKLRMH